MPHSDELVLIAISHSEIEATIWRDALEQEGVPAFVRNRDPLAALGVPTPFPTLELYVVGRDEKRARWVIGEAVEPAEFVLLAEQEQEPATFE